MQYQKSNLNNFVKFKPTPAAFEAYHQHNKEVLGPYYPAFKRWTLEVDADGFCKMQLYVFANIFGPYLHIGMNPTVDTEIFIECQ